MTEGDAGEPLICRSVYDARPGRPALRHLCLALLNAVTWARYAADTPLELTIVGTPQPNFLALLRDLGVTVTAGVEPHALAGGSPTYNKLLALPGAAPGGRVLLLDNDTVLLGSPGPLAEVDPALCQASVADRARVAPELWTEMIEELAAPLVESPWVPWLERFEAWQEGRPAREERFLYFNSGVVLLPAGTEGARFGALWNAYGERLGAYAARKGYAQRATFGSDQAALAMAMADYGALGHLDLRYHYRPFHFWQGDLEGPAIRILHLFASRPVFEPLAREAKWKLESFLGAYWEAVVCQRIAPGDSGRREAADFVLARIQEALRHYEVGSVEPFWPASAR